MLRPVWPRDIANEIDCQIVSYTLHTAASAIVLFVQSHQALPEAQNEPNQQSKRNRYV